MHGAVLKFDCDLAIDKNNQLVRLVGEVDDILPRDIGLVLEQDEDFVEEMLLDGVATTFGAHTHTHTHTNRHTDTQTHRHTDTQTQTQTPGWRRRRRLSHRRFRYMQRPARATLRANTGA